MPGSNRRCKKYGTNLQLCKAALQLLGLNALLVCLLQPVHQLSIAALLMRDCSHSLAGSRHNFLPWEPLPAFHRQCSLQPDDPTVEWKGKERKGKERKGRKRQGKAKPFGANVMRSQVFYRAAQRLTKLCLFQHQRPVLTRCNPVGLSVTYNSTKAVGVLVMYICTMTSRLARSDHKEGDGSLNLAGICRGLP